MLLKMTEEDKHYRWMVFGVTALATFMATLDAGIVNVALPAIARQLNVELSVVQWVISAYLLGISGLLPLFGKVSDIYGRRKIYLTGMGVFVLGSFLCCVSPAIWYLIISRIIQSVGASMLMANALAIVSTVFQGPERGRAMGLNSTFVALGSLAGPSLGGILIGNFTWQSIFYINIPIGIIALLFGYMLLPGDEKKVANPFDYIGAVLFVLFMTSLLLVISHGQDWGWNSSLIYSLFLVAMVTLGLFLWCEIHIEYPMIEMGLFKNDSLLSGTISAMLAYMALFSNNILLPFYLERVLCATPMQIGMIITPLPLLIAITAPVSGYLSEKINPATLTATGLFIMMGGLVYLASLNDYANVWHVVFSQVVMGLGNGLFQAPNNYSVLSSVSKEKVGLVGGINSLVRNVGMVSGVAVAVAVFESRSQQMFGSTTTAGSEHLAAFISGYHAAIIVAACLAGIGAVISFNRRKYLQK
ncbi:MAG: drug resistance transporter, EmrB/QacA subfamily [Firmicutes bacterium]|nr:drug resistance transporter, EmrB/QacA subfamily [Bacillota bacterium]